MLDHLSISQLKLHAKNPRRWCLEYLEGIKLPPSKHLIFGSHIHSHIENYFEIENWRPTKPIFPQAVEYLKKWYIDNKYLQNINTRLEDSFRIWLSPELPPVEGRIDMWSFHNNILELYDHKTCTQGYEETEQSLEKDWQMALYLYVLISEVSTIERFSDFRIGHIQFFKDKELNIIRDAKVIIHPTLKNLYILIDDIRAEAYKLMETYKVYMEKGLQAVRETPKNKWWYGKPCDYWPCIVGKETVEECRKRIGNKRKVKFNNITQWN